MCSSNGGMINGCVGGLEMLLFFEKTLSRIAKQVKHWTELQFQTKMEIIWRAACKKKLNVWQCVMSLKLNVKLSLQVPMNFLLILEAIFRGGAVFHFGQVLNLLQLLELLVIADVRVVGRQAHQVVH